jgi:putative cell wall-binding protein
LPTPRRRAGIAALATSLVLGASLATAGSASAAPDFGFDRIEGANRYATSAAAATEFGKADTVILASGEKGRYPDALTANYLAGVKNAPILLTRKDSVPTEVKKAIADSDAKTVLIVGGTDVVSQSVQDDLDGTYTVRRIAGPNRFATAAAVIDEGDKASTDTALLATGRNFPDALGGGPLAFAEKMPLAITEADDAPDNVVKSLDRAGITKVLVLGGKDVVSDAVVQELADSGISLVKRFDGVDRADTAAQLAEYEIAQYNFSKAAVNVASGYNDGDGADALGGAPLSGKTQRPLLITKTQNAPGAAVLKFLGDHSATLTEGTIFGGTAALTKDAENQMVKAVLKDGALNQTTNAFYPTAQAAVDAAKAGETINLFGSNAGFVVKTKDLEIVGDSGATVTSAISVLGVDGVSISGLKITPSNVGGPQVAGIYLDNAEGVTITGNDISGGPANGAGVINTSGGDNEVATISDNKLHDLTQGVYANPSATFTITGNEFRDNVAGSANDAVSTIKGNEFVNNTEGVGMSVAGSTVTGNSFVNSSDDHVGDYTSDKAYDLDAIIAANTFDEEVVVNADGTKIVDKN